MCTHFKKRLTQVTFAHESWPSSKHLCVHVCKLALFCQGLGSKAIADCPIYWKVGGSNPAPSLSVVVSLGMSPNPNCSQRWAVPCMAAVTHWCAYGWMTACVCSLRFCVSSNTLWHHKGLLGFTIDGKHNCSLNYVTMIRVFRCCWWQSGGGVWECFCSPWWNTRCFSVYRRRPPERWPHI